MKKLLLICLCIFAIGETAMTQNQIFWGLTPYGGAFNGGTLFTVNSNGAGFNIEHEFQPPAGFTPYGSLLQAVDGNLYGTCLNGGSMGSCTIFRFEPSTGIYADVYDFDVTHGDFPRSGVLQAADGKLYGVATSGGLHSAGVLYSYDPLTDIYVAEVDFDQATGSLPWGCPLNVNGILYGLTNTGGANSMGVLYSYDISTHTYSDLFHFNGSSGASPQGSLILAGNGKLYGMTALGGASNNGVIFCFDPATNVYSKLLDFNIINGASPYGSLVEANNGFLFGVASAGGTANAGVLFAFYPSNNAYYKLVDFNVVNGATPVADLYQGSNGELYGSTTSGGANNFGNIFSYNYLSTALTSLFDFSSTTGYGGTGGFRIVTANGIEQLNGSNGLLSFYPNPVTDKVTIKLNMDKLEKADINITNAVGQNIYSFSESNAGASYSKTIDMSKFNKGVYFLECTVDGEKSVTKMVKQ